MFQEPRLFEWYDALGNLTISSRLPARQASARAMELIERVGLTDSLHKKPSELSGGMKQRLALARAFMPDKKIVILDEPFSALDEENRSRMRELVSELVIGKTLIYVTHDKEDLAIADRVISPDAGGVFVAS